MSNVYAFPARTRRYVNPPSYWRTYKVYAVDTTGDHHVLTYRALSVDSANCRARRDGFTHINKIEVQTDDK